MANGVFMAARNAEVANEFNDWNLFAQELRKKYPNAGKHIVSQYAKKLKLQSKFVSRAFMGKAVTSSIASKVARGLGFEGTQLFITIPVGVPKKDRKRPSKLRQYMSQS